MGYFRKPIRRGTARKKKRAFVDVARSVNPDGWTSDFNLTHAARDTFLRFLVDHPDKNAVGPFQSSNLLVDDPTLPASTHSRCRAIFRWFNLNIRHPGRLPRRAVCWFRADADECLKRIRELIEIYRVANHTVWMQSTTRPGRIVYQDEHQIAAVPFTDRRVTADRG
jgi:hypothetical protein